MNNMLRLLSFGLLLLVMMGISPARAQGPGIAFLIPESSTKAMSEGMAKFRKEYPVLAKEANIAVYPGDDLSGKLVEPDLSTPDVIFLNHLDYKVMLEMEEALKQARQRGAKVIGLGGYDIFTEKGCYNVDMALHPDLELYWDYNGDENIKRLITYLLHKFCGVVDIAIEPPVEIPQKGIYHPDASEVFDSLDKYLEWYKHDKNAPWVGLLAYNLLKSNNNKVEQAIIREMEAQGLNVICAMGYPAEETFAKYLMKEGKPQVDVVISLTFSHPKEESTRMLKAANIPIIRGITLSSKLEEWLKSPQGIEPFQLAYQVFLPELSGLIEPIVLGGKCIFVDKETGIKVTERVPAEERIEKVVKRAKAWTKLRHLSNPQKKVAVIYYNHHTGKQNLGAAYLDLFESLKMLLDSLKGADYSLGKEKSFSKETLQEMILMQGRNISTSAPGELKNLVEKGNIVMVPIEKYKQWFDRLPSDFKKGVLEKWGDVEKTKLMTWEDKGEKYIVIPGLIFGNVFLGPQPTRGWLAESDHLYHDLTLPPHHQYLAFYLWLKHEFKTDAIVHFGKHGTLEWTPGKQVGLSENCAPDVLMQDIPDIYPYLVDDIGEGTQAKRRGCGVIIDHMIPAIKMSGLYKEYARINELIPLYEQSKDQTPAVAEKYKEEILELTKELGIEKDVGINFDKGNFEKLLDVLHDYLAEIRGESMPYGLHILGVSLKDESLISMVTAMLGVETDIPSFQEIVARTLSMDWEKMKKHPGRYIKDAEKTDAACEALLTKVIIEKMPAEKTFPQILGENYSKASSKEKAWLQEIVKRGIGYAENLSLCDQEIKSILNGLNAGYITPGPGNDPIRDPGVLPTGRNFYGFNPEKLPTRAAWNVGKKLAEDLIEGYLKKNKRYPHKVAIILWATESLRHHGIMESKALYLMGARPVWDGRGCVKGIELIPESELKRPRIDILVNASGLYRDVFPLQIGLIDDAVQLILRVEKEKYENFVRKHTLEAEQLFKEKGYSEEEAAEFARYRIFGAPNQGYGTGLDDAISASGTWEKDDKLSDLYINRLNYAYGRNVWGKQAKDAFKESLKGTDIIVHSRSTNVFGVLDNDDFYQYMGGMAMAIRNLSGKTPELQVADAKNPSAPKMVNFAKFIGLETRARYFNPKWITGMKEHGYSGAREMTKFTEHLWGWQVTTPKEVSKEMWEQAYQVYVEDKYGMELKKFFEKNSPHAYQAITARMLEVERKGYQKFDKKMLEKIAKEYIESVVRHGMACSDNTCDNIKLNRFAAKMMCVPGLVSPEVIAKFQKQVKMTTGLDVKLPEQIKERKVEDKKPQTTEVKQESKGIGQKLEKELGGKKPENVKGYKMEEEKRGETAKLSPAKVIMSAIVIILFVLGIIGLGWWRGMKA